MKLFSLRTFVTYNLCGHLDKLSWKQELVNVHFTGQWTTVLNKKGQSINILQEVKFPINTANLHQ